MVSQSRNPQLNSHCCENLIRIKKTKTIQSHCNDNPEPHVLVQISDSIQLQKTLCLKYWNRGFKSMYYKAASWTIRPGFNCNVWRARPFISIDTQLVKFENVTYCDFISTHDKQSSNVLGRQIRKIPSVFRDKVS